MSNIIQEKLIAMIGGQKNGKSIMLIHNLKNINTLKQMDEAISRDILEVFTNARKEVDERTGCVFYKSDKIIHFIYAEEGQGSEAGRFYNNKTTNKILNFVSNMNLEEMPIPNFYPRLMHSLQKNVEPFLFNKTLEDNFIVKQTQKKKFVNKVKDTIFSLLGVHENMQTSHETTFSKLEV